MRKKKKKRRTVKNGSRFLSLEVLNKRKRKTRPPGTNLVPRSKDTDDGLLKKASYPTKTSLRTQNRRAGITQPVLERIQQNTNLQGTI